MKTKKTGKKLNLLVKRITSLAGKGEKGKSEASGTMKTLQTELETTLGLKQEIKALKSTLKTRKKDLANGVAKLDKNSKRVKKDLKSGHKAEKKVAKSVAADTKKATKKASPAKAEKPVAPKVKRTKAKAGSVKQ